MAITVVPIAGTELRLVPGAWPLPAALRRQVPDCWARMVAARPGIWDGRIYGFTPPQIDERRVLRAEAREDDYSAYLTWREAGFPEMGWRHIFVTALICSADGAIILGVMGRETLNAGRVYPPGGVLEPRDLGPDGMVDAEAAIALELMEETGLDASVARPGALLAIFDEPRVCISRALHFDASAAELVQVVRRNIAEQDEPELADVVACRNVQDGRAAGELANYAGVLLDQVSSGQMTL